MMVSSRLVECPEDLEESDMEPNPDMMFAVGEEPVGVRILTYQSSSALKRIFNALDEDEIDIIRQSSFGKLVEIADKPSFSGRFVRYMLSRQMKTKKKHETWFRFAGKPVRFSLREFAIVTGLPCGKYPKKSKMKLKETIAEQPYWPCLFGKVETVSVAAVLKMLYRKTVKDREIRIKYACLALLESVLLPTSNNMKISRDHVEAIKDLQAFLSYPWGRVAFDMLMVSIKERDEIALSRDTISVKGFVLALQLVLVQAVPELTESVQDTCSSSESESEALDGNGLNIFLKKPSLNPAHARNVDKKSDAKVCSVLFEDPRLPLDETELDWSDEENDSRVATMLARIERSYPFNVSSFRGGLTQLEVSTMRDIGSSSVKSKRGNKDNSIVQVMQPGYITSHVMEKITPRFEELENNLKVTSSRVAAMEGTVVAQVECLFGKLKEQVLSSVTELVSAQCNELLSVHIGTTQIPTAVVNHVTVPASQGKAVGDVSVPASQGKAVGDANDMAIRDTLRAISDYSTPPPATHVNEHNLSPNTNNHGASGYVCVTPIPQSRAQSANSENRSRQHSFQLRLGGHTIQPQHLSDGPSFSIGLTQELHGNRGENPVQQVGEEEHNVEVNVADNIDCGVSTRKSKRQRTVPSGLVEDYLCGPNLISRQREAQRCVFVLQSMEEMRRKYANLVTKLKGKFVLNVSGLAVYGRDILCIIERPKIYSAKVVDILVRVLRSVISQHIPPVGPQSAEFLDTKFVSTVMKNFPKFLKSENKEAYVFPKGLSDLFPGKESPNRHPSRYYFPFNVANNHWVGICFDAGGGSITILDCFLAKNKDAAVEKLIKPLAQMLPYLGRYAGQPIDEEPVIQCYDFHRPKSVAQNTNIADSGLMALLFMAKHALYGVGACKNITKDMLHEEGKRAAILAYEFHEKL